MFCSKVKEYLSQKGIEFIERDVSKDEDAINDLKKLGVMTTPVTVIDGETVIGFNQQKFEQLLGL
jgi:glutaredoxin